LFYIVNAKGEVIGSASGAVNTEDLALSGCIAVASDLKLPPSEVSVSGLPDKPQIVEQPKTAQPILVLSTTAQDQDGDGVPELKADGRSNTKVTATTQTRAGETIKAVVPVTFRTTAGRLAARIVDTEDGVATVTFTAGRETVTVHITASAVGYDSASLFIEFVP
jgi:hypothetical protein